MKIKILTVLAATLAATFTANAEVIRFDITEKALAFEGRVFPNVGTYTVIKAKAVIALDPNDKRNAVIADLSYAPKNAKGLVEASADVVLLASTGIHHGLDWLAR